MKKNTKLTIFLLASLLMLAGCSNNKVANNTSLQNEDYYVFDTNPNNYKTAKATKNISLPKYIADNIEAQDLYPLESTKLNSDLSITSVPPSLAGKIAEY